LRRVRPQSVASSGAVASCLLSFFLSSPRCPFGLSFEGSQGDPRRHQHRHRHHLNLSHPTRSRSFFFPATHNFSCSALPFVEIGALSQPSPIGTVHLGRSMKQKRVFYLITYSIKHLNICMRQLFVSRTGCRVEWAVGCQFEKMLARRIKAKLTVKE